MPEVITADVFGVEVDRIIKAARAKGEKYIDVISGEVHRKVGGYPAQNHKMPTCCDVMYSKMKSNDEILYAPPKGKGSTLKIRYFT